MDGISIRKIIGTPFVIAVFAITLIGAGVGPLIVSQPAAAATTGTGVWVDQTHIYYNEGHQLFTEINTQSAGGTSVMFLQAPGACQSVQDQMNIGGTHGGTYQNSREAFIQQLPSDCSNSGTGITLTMSNTYNQLGTGNSAPGYAQWVDDSSLKDLGTGNVYSKTNITGNTMTLTYVDAAVNGACPPNKILVGDNTNSYLTAGTATLTINIQTTPNGQPLHCAQQVKTLTIVNQHYTVAITGAWQGTDPYGQIQLTNVPPLYENAGVIHKGDIYLEPSCAGTCKGFPPPINGTNMVLNKDANNCHNTMSQIHVDPYQTAVTATLTTWGPPIGGRGGVANCIPYTLQVDITQPYGGTPTGTPTQNPTSVNDGCILPTDNQPLRWIMCPVMTTLQAAATAVNAFMSSQLEVSPSEFFNSGTQNAFNVFRDIGVAMLVIAGLAMVISQAADLEIFAAHTVRKALPRIIIAAIIIAISWPLLQFIVGFFNDMGAWVGKIILSVADALPTQGDAFGQIMANLGDTLILGVVAAGAVTLLGAAGIISMLFSIILLILVGVFVLAIRQIIVLICILMTPMAIAAYVVPGTEKIGRFWKDTLITALVMFPLIEAFLAAGAALSYIILSVKSGNYFYHIVAVIVFVAPYVTIPLAFRLAGGLIGRFAEFAQGTHNKTIESRLQGFRQSVSAKNWNAFRGGSRYNPDHPATPWLGGRGINFVGRHVGAGFRGRFGFGAIGAAGMANNMALTADAASKMDTNFAAQMNNEEAMAAVAFGNNRQRLSSLTYFNAAGLLRTQRSQLERIVQDRAGGTLSGAALDHAINQEAQDTATRRLNSALAAGNTIQATQQMQTAAADALIRSGKVLENRDEFSAMVDSISHGNTSLAQGQRGSLQYTARQIGREDLGRNDVYSALKEMDMATVARQKPKSLENLFGTNAIIEAIDHAANQDEQEHFADILYAAYQNQSLSPEQQAEIAKAVQQVQTHPSYGLTSPTNNLWATARSHYTSKISPGGGTPPSDRRLKQHIRHIHTLGNGIKLYSFQYIWGGPHYVGVMAQDLLETHPDAVILDEKGYYRVHYDRLGLEMTTLDVWQNGQK